MGLGVYNAPQSDGSLLDRVRRTAGSRYATGMETDAGRQVDTGGLSASGFGLSPIAQGGYGQTSQHPGQQAHRLTDGYDPTTRFASNGVTMAPARLVQRINPVSPRRGGIKKEMEVGGP